MALVVNDRVQQTGTANTTVSFTLSGSVTGYQSFSVIGNGNTTFYGATDTTGNWEVGIGTYATGGTLTRTTILASSNSGSAVTFSGTVNVFVTYPSEKSVNLDGSGNVTSLGTIASGTWQGSTVGVAYGGTGVTTSSGANSVVLRDVNQNISFNNYVAGFAATTAAAGTTTLTVASARNQILVGSTTQTFQLPNATTLSLGQSFIFVNNSSGVLTVKDNSGATIESVPSGGVTQMGAISISTSAGSWGSYSFIPAAVDWGTNALNLASTVISGGTWNGGTIAPGYGGTGLTTFAAANNALYSTSSSALAAGTLPIAAGGTAGTTAATAFNNLSPMTTTGDIIYEASAGTAARLGVGSTGQVLTVASGVPTWTTPTTGGGTVTTTDFTATSGQTVFTTPYTVGAVEVYRNGIKLGQADYTATNGTSITLATGAITGDLVEVVTFSSLNLYSTITYQDFSGTGSQTVFTMSAVPANSASLLVAINGIVQDPGNYSVSSNTLTFTTAPASGTNNISVRYLGVASVGTVGSFSAGTTGFTPSTATTGAVTLAGTLNIANGGTGSTSAAIVAGTGITVSGTFPNQTITNSAPATSGPAFAVYMQNGGANYGTSGGTYTKVPYDTVEYDTNSNFSTANKRFTPTVAGYYMFTATVGMGGATDEIQVAIYKNGSMYKNNNIGATSNIFYPSLPITHIMYMNGSTDYVEIYSYWHVGTSNVQFGSANTFWSGCWLRS